VSIAPLFSRFFEPEPESIVIARVLQAWFG
jgi:hypothetical protein